MNYPKEIEKDVDELLAGEQLALGPPLGWLKRLREMKRMLQKEQEEKADETENE